MVVPALEVAATDSEDENPKAVKQEVKEENDDGDMLEEDEHVEWHGGDGTKEGGRGR